MPLQPSALPPPKLAATPIPALQENCKLCGPEGAARAAAAIDAAAASWPRGEGGRCPIWQETDFLLVGPF